MKTSQSRLLEPFNIASLTLRNRIVLAPMGTMLVSADGSVNDHLINYYRRYALGGVGLLVPEGQHIDDQESAVLPNGLAIHNDRYLAGLNRLVEAVKDEGAAIVAQLGHAGHQTVPENIHGLQPVAPSPIANRFLGVVPRELDQAKIDEIQDSFAACAFRAMVAGFDGVEIHGGNGYLLTEFLSPRLNLRKDKYGGTIENRARMALEVLGRIRARTAPGFLVGYRVCADEHVPGSLTQEDLAAFSRMLEAAGIDYISVTAGTYESNIFGVPVMHVPRGSNLHLSRLIKQHVKVPVMCAGGLNAELAEQAIVDGSTDLAVIGRGLIADPELPIKLMEGRAEDIRPCVRGNQGCISRTIRRIGLSCEVNPGITREFSGKADRAEKPGRVLVLGGGVAGMEAARRAAEVGHTVTLVERASELGGHVIEASAPEFKKDLRPLLEWLSRQLAKEGVDVRLKTEATNDLVRGLGPDGLILALGSEYALPGGMSRRPDRFFFPDEVLLGLREPGENVTVVGGGFVGCETALYLAQSLKRNVTIVEALDMVLRDCDEPMTMTAIMMGLETNGIRVHTGTRFEAFVDGVVRCLDSENREVNISADALVGATGLRPRSLEASGFAGLVPLTFQVGDCVRPGKIYDAMRSAWRAVEKLQF